MLCSPAEIERKKQEALQKLAQKRLSPIKSSNIVNITNSEVASPRFTFKGRPETKVFDHTKKPYDKPSEITQNSVNFYGKEKAVTIKISLISSTWFCVDLNSFCASVIDIFKTIPTRHYDPQARTWTFGINCYDLLMSKLNQLRGQYFMVEELPRFVINCLNCDIKSCDIDFDRIDPALSQALLPFQVDGVKFGIERGGRCLIGDDMGMGKTFQALAIMNYYQQDWPLLIVTTASMKNIWEEIILKYLPLVSIMHVQYMITTRDYIGDSKILIVSHDLMQRCCDKLLERNFGCIIIDESHYIKNYKAKLSQAATKLAKKASRIVLLSGTPALSRPAELYQQLSLLDQKFFGNFHNFAIRYCDRKKNKWGWDDLGKSNLQELEVVLNKKFMIRRTKEDVIKSLPNKTQELVLLDVHLEKFSEEDRRCLKALASKYKQEKGHEKHAALLSFFSETARIKIPSVCSYILQVLESNQKFLVFAHHHVMLNAIEDVVKRKNVGYIRIDGTTTSGQRKYFVDKFQQDETCLCAVLSITAANAGITLTAAQLVLFAELHWNPTILNQAEARAHRIGQEGSVLVQYLLADDTADDSIWPLLLEKEKSLSEFGLCKMSLTKADLKTQNSHNNAVTSGLNITIDNVNTTIHNTMDITSYFNKYPKKKSSDSEKSPSSSMFDELLEDGLDDMLCNIDF